LPRTHRSDRLALPSAPFAAAPTLALLAIAVGAVLLLGPVPAQAQSGESENAPARGEFDPAPIPVPESGYAVPELSEATTEKFAVRERLFTLKFGLALLVDHNSFDQDAPSLDQVGEQEDGWDDRSLRGMLRGTIGHEYKASYLVAGEYKGFDTEPGDTWNMTDVSLTFPLGGPETKLTVGKTKESFVYEMVGDAANLPQQERVLSPFFASRNVGLRLNRVLGAEHRMTAALGVFNDWWVDGDSFDDSGTDVAARFTGLLWDDPDRHRFLHVGVAGRFTGAENGVLRYKGRPESNVTDNYVDTGNLSADHGLHLGLEALWNHGPFSLLAEYARADVDAPAHGDPVFDGAYLTFSWVVTGETRPYDRTVGYARRVMPTGRWGAPEIVARLSTVDLDDGSVAGGSFDKVYLGVNWWATRRWKAGAGWGRTWLDRFGVEGRTDAVQLRAQWIF
jgi:phosphate-selective porin OprO/OprP